MAAVGDKKYICLAAYRCKCNHVGKPVARSTMIRHRKIANETRSQLGLPNFGNGPRHSVVNAQDQFRIFLSQVGDAGMGGGAGSRDGDNGGPSVPIPDSEHNAAFHHSIIGVDDDGREPTMGGDDGIIDVELPTVVQEGDNGMKGSMIRTSSSSGSSINLSGGSNLPELWIVAQRSTSSIVSGASGSAPNVTNHMDDVNAMSDRSLENGLHSNQHIAVGQTRSQEGGIHALARERFDDWVSSNRSWINIFVDEGLTLKAQDAILTEIKAPTKVRQLRRNFEKYTHFKSVDYFACRKHMLLTAVAGLDGEAELECMLCTDRGTTPDIVIFEYLPLLPRIKAWVANEKSCSELFSHYQKKCAQVAALEDNHEGERFYEDAFDGEVYRRIAQQCGGYEAVRYDVFIAPSTDGFQTFENGSYDCWPIAALNYNLDPTQRYIVKNIIPLGFLKGPEEPLHIDTWFIPLFQEINEINEGGGTSMQFFDGSTRKVRVHVIFQTGDKPSVNKQAGLVGHNGRCPCRFCIFAGVWHPTHKHLYYPTRCDVTVTTSDDSTAFRIGDGAHATEVTVLWEPESLHLRSESDIEETLASLEDMSLSKAARDRIRTRTGIKWRTVPLYIHSIYPYVSFPLDTMHTWMNVCKDVMDIFKGNCAHLQQSPRADDRFCLSRSQWLQIDSEMNCIPKGTSRCAFPNVPRNTLHYSTWKAVECIEFLSTFATIVFDGVLPRAYVRNLHMLSQLVEMSRRPMLSQTNVDEMKRLGVEFVLNFESLYYKYDADRVGVCKSTIHDIVHLGWMVEQCGPLVNYSQFWVERFIGFIKHLLHATILAAESMNETAKMTERVKLYFGDHFVTKDEVSVSIQQDGDTGAGEGEMKLLFPSDAESLNGSYHAQKRTRQLLGGYICRAEGINPEVAIKAASNNAVMCFGRAQISVGNDVQVIGACKARRHRPEMLRSDWYISAEFCTDEEECRDLYYGRVLKFLRYTFLISGVQSTRDLALIEWASGLKVNQYRQVHKPGAIDSVFRNATVEDVSVVHNSIGVLEHRSERSRGKHTFFVDPTREVNGLLDLDKVAADGVNRTLVVTAG